MNGPVISHESALTYTPQNPLLVTNRISCDEPLLSLLWRPQLPSGWTLESVSGDGSPEAVGGEIVWVGAILPSPITMVYAARVPVGEKGPREIRGEVEYLTLSMMNPATMFASPDPVMVYWSPDLRIALQPGKIVLTWPTGDPDLAVEAADNLNAPIRWLQVTNTPVVIDDRITVEIEIDRATRFYRLRRP